MPESAGLRTLTSPASQLVPSACRFIAQAHADESPNLTRLTVLLPNLHAQSGFARALQGDLNQAVVLLPRVTTLRGWAAAIALDREVMAPAAREVLLYQALSERRWFPQADLWGLAAELSALFDELTRWHVGLPASIDDFKRRLERAYRARAGASFELEARLVHTLWHALAESNGRLDTEAAYQVRLGVLAKTVSDPVYTIGLGTLAAAETSFFERCAERASVVHFAADMNRPAAMSPVERTVVAAWPEMTDETLAQRAIRLRRSDPTPSLLGRLRFFGAAGPEQEAMAIDVSVRQWLLDGRKSIAVVVLDRVVARRARALLERAEVLVRDEAGWALSTTSAATAIGRWLDVCGNDFYHRDLLDLLKSPFAFCDWNRAARQQTVWRLERELRKAGVRAGLERYLALAESSRDLELRQMLSRVQRAMRAFDRGRRKSLSGWLHALDASLKEIGVKAGLEADAAGIQLLELLASLGAELAAGSLSLSFGEFRRWLSRRLESATFRDAGIDSPVIFTSLEATRLRSFDAVLVVGADAIHLPGAEGSSLFFNQAVRRDLGLPGRAQRLRELETVLAELMANSREIVVTWQSTRNGEGNLLSPLFERLRTLHALAWSDSLPDRDLAQRMVHSELRVAALGVPAAAIRRPAPSAPPARVPSRISASGYNALMACPYQYFARYVLGLRALDEVQEQLDKSDYGTRVHEILTRFHRSHPRVSDMTMQAATTALEAISSAVFENAIAADYLASAWLARWRGSIPQYIEWQRAREAEGWRFHDGEVDCDLPIRTPAGHTVTLRGRIDRIDRRPDGSVEVLDYKTQSRDKLKEKLQSAGEDVQLPVYSLLWGAPVAAASYLSLEREVDAVPLRGDIDSITAGVRARLANLQDQIMQGAALPAQGIDAVCEYCEMSGLCRRKHWP